jgi:hypothetical protein
MRQTPRRPTVFPALALFAILAAFYSVLTGIAELHGAHLGVAI